MEVAREVSIGSSGVELHKTGVQLTTTTTTTTTTTA